MEKILFVCTGNTCRSAMADIYFNFLAEKLKDFPFYAESAGTIADSGWTISSGAAHVLTKNKITLPKRFQSSPLDAETLNESKIVFVMTNSHKEFIKENFPAYYSRVLLLSEIENKVKDIADPMGFDNNFFEETFASIKYYIDNLISKLKEDNKFLDSLLAAKKIRSSK